MDDDVDLEDDSDEGQPYPHPLCLSPRYLLHRSLLAISPPACVVYPCLPSCRCVYVRFHSAARVPFASSLSCDRCTSCQLAPIPSAELDLTDFRSIASMSQLDLRLTRALSRSSSMRLTTIVSSLTIDPNVNPAGAAAATSKLAAGCVPCALPAVCVSCV